MKASDDSLLRVLRIARKNAAVDALRRPIEIELRVRTMLATVPGIGVACGEAPGSADAGSE